MCAQEDRASGIVSFLVGMGIGAAAVALGALLYAPRPGAETRHNLAEALNDLRGRAERLAEKLRRATSDVADQLRQDVEAAVAAGTEAACARRAQLERTVGSESER